MFKWAKDLLTEPDGETACPVRFCLIGIASAYHGAAVYGLWSGKIPLDMAALGQYMQHMIMLITAGGGGIIAKTKLGADTPRSP